MSLFPPLCRRCRSSAIGVVVVALSQLAGTPATAQTVTAAVQRTVIIMTAESPEMPGSAIMREGIVSVLRGEGAEPAKVYEEAIDTTRFAGSDYDAKLAALYRAKYGTTPPALVITIGQPALDFMLRHREALFPAAPILFGFVDERAVSHPAPPNVTGVAVRVEARATIETALRLHPGTRHVVVVGGVSAFDRAWVSLVRQELHGLESNASFTYLTGPYEKLIADVAALRDQTLVLFVSMTLDGDGTPRVPLTVVESLRRVAQVPIYGLASSFLGHGIVGGMLLDMRRHGTDLGLRAREILTSTGATNLPLMTTANVAVFDGRELTRFGIDEGLLPPGATIANGEVSLWRAYRGTVLAIGAVLAGQFLLIGGLLVQRQRRRRAERALHDLSGRLLSAQEDERRRIARGLHDNVSQRVALLAIEIERLAMTAGPTGTAVQTMRGLGERTAEISAEIHTLSHGLRSAKLDALGLAAAVRGHCRELVAQELTAHFREEHVPHALSYDVELCLFRIVQEGLNNVVKHSGVREAQVALTSTADAVVLTISDAGRGFEKARPAVHEGLGLASMRERTRLIGGELTIRSEPGRGTTITVRVPITDTVVGSRTSDGTVRVA